MQSSHKNAESFFLIFSKLVFSTCDVFQFMYSIVFVLYKRNIHPREYGIATYLAVSCRVFVKYSSNSSGQCVLVLLPHITRSLSPFSSLLVLVTYHNTTLTSTGGKKSRLYPFLYLRSTFHIHMISSGRMPVVG